MTDEDISKFRGEIKEEIKPVTKKLDILWDQVVKVTEGLEDVKETLESHTVVLKRIEIKVEHNSEKYPSARSYVESLGRTHFLREAHRLMRAGTLA